MRSSSPRPAAPVRRAAPGHLAVPLALLAAAALGACKRDGASALTARATMPDSADQVMFGLRHQLTNAGIRRAQLLADTAYFYDEGNRIELRKVRTVFFGAAGDSNAVMTGREGTYDVRQQRLDGRGNVVITTVDGRRLASPHLVYDRLSNQVSSDTTFTFDEPGRSLSGIGFRSDPQLRNLQVLRGAKGRAELSGTALSRPPAGAGSAPTATPPTATPPTATPPTAAPPTAAPTTAAPRPAAPATPTPAPTAPTAPATSAPPPGARP